MADFRNAHSDGQWDASDFVFIPGGKEKKRQRFMNKMLEKIAQFKSKLGSDKGEDVESALPAWAVMTSDEKKQRGIN